MTTWILVAHGSAGKILEVEKNGEKIATRKDFFHPKTRKKASSANPGSASGTFHPTVPLRHAIDYSGELENHERAVFAKEISEFLGKAQGENSFDSLILVASREFLGELRRALPDRVIKITAHELNKDLLSQGFTDEEIIEKIRADLDLLHL